MLLLVAPPERSIARNACPQSPTPFIPPWTMVPPILTAALWSNVGVWPPICALLERTQRKELPFTQPPIKTLPFVSTSSVPYMGELGTTIGDCQVTPPLVDRENSTPPPLQLMPSSAWYWNPWPGPFVLSMVNHSLSPPPPPLSGDCSTHVCPPLVERH